MDQPLAELRTEALAAIAAAADETALEQARVKYLGQAGVLPRLLPEETGLGSFGHWHALAGSDITE